MSTAPDPNAAFLQAAVAWVKARLRERVPPPPRRIRRRGWCWWLRRRRVEEVTPPAPQDREAVARAAEALRQVEEANPSALPFRTLCQKFRLRPFEQEVLLLCLAAELDTQVGWLCARVQDDARRPYPTFALALALADDPDWAALSPGRPLRYWRLIEVIQPATVPLVAAALRLDEHILHLLKGAYHLDSRLAGLVAPAPAGAGTPLPHSQEHAADAMSQRWDQKPRPVIELLGPDAESKLLVAAEAARRRGRALYRLAADQLPPDPVTVEALARLWDREYRMAVHVLYVDADEPPDPTCALRTEPRPRPAGTGRRATGSATARRGTSARGRSPDWWRATARSRTWRGSATRCRRRAGRTPSR
jgi:hypothetical protein